MNVATGQIVSMAAQGGGNFSPELARTDDGQVWGIRYSEWNGNRYLYEQLRRIDPATGRKIAGGAQRRSRGAFLHQGSVRLPEGMRSPDAPWVASFLAGLALSTMSLGEEIRKGLLAAGEDLVVSRYGDPAWNEPTTG